MPDFAITLIGTLLLLTLVFVGSLLLPPIEAPEPFQAFLVYSDPVTMQQRLVLSPTAAALLTERFQEVSRFAESATPTLAHFNISISGLLTSLEKNDD